MDLMERFKSIEGKIGAVYAAQFYEFLSEFNELSKKEKFLYVFRKFHFPVDEEIQQESGENFPSEYAPFFVEDHDEFKDYYCFERNNFENSNKIVVSSQGSVVMEWGRWSDFICWLKNKLAE